eukprot:1395420-Amorphochlora_amoeboformis.AAC.1
MVKEHISITDYQARIRVLERQKQELQAQLDTVDSTTGSPAPGRNRRGRQVLSVRNNARRAGTQDRKARRDVMSMGGSMDETNKLQGHIELLREQQRMQTERHDEFAQVGGLRWPWWYCGVVGVGP